MSQPGPFDDEHDAQDPAVDGAKASRLARLACAAFQVTVLMLATVVVGLYVFPLK